MAEWDSVLPHLVPFVAIFPGQGQRETRTLTTFRHGRLPDDEYALTESYCPDPACDCRRVMLNVVARRQLARGPLASISFGFDRGSPWAGPFLDPLNPQSEYARTLFALVTQVLTDPQYVRRLEAHYGQLKRAAVAQVSAAHQALLRLLTDQERRELRQAARAARADAARRSEGAGPRRRSHQTRTKRRKR